MYVEVSADLIQRARHERHAFGEIYDVYARRVYAFCVSRTRDQREAEDLTSQTFERALGAIARYEDRGAPLSAWLLQIAANLSVDRARQTAHTVQLEEDQSPVAYAERSDEAGPEEWVEQWELAGWLDAHMDQLPADQGQALRLRYWGGHSVREVASRMSRNENATKQLLHRGLKQLRTRIAGEDSSHV